MLIIGVLKFISIQLWVDSREKITELISSQSVEEDPGRSLGFGQGKGLEKGTSKGMVTFFIISYLLN